jgi:hypothetical protein
MKTHQWLLRIRADQFLHAKKFGEILENKSTNKLHVVKPITEPNTEPPNL